MENDSNRASSICVELLSLPKTQAQPKQCQSWNARKRTKNKKHVILERPARRIVRVQHRVDS